MWHQVQVFPNLTGVKFSAERAMLVERCLDKLGGTYRLRGSEAGLPFDIFLLLWYRVCIIKAEKYMLDINRG
jgi:hypothetical protein